jgi:hypothetical protein
MGIITSIVMPFLKGKGLFSLQDGCFAICVLTVTHAMGVLQNERIRRNPLRNNCTRSFRTVSEVSCMKAQASTCEISLVDVHLHLFILHYPDIQGHACRTTRR